MSKKLQKTSSVNELIPKKTLEEIDKVSKNKKLTAPQKSKLIKKIEKEYLENSFEPGEAVGIISAQSLSEPATQMTMRTYHFAGSAGMQVTLGLPRLIELFDARKEPTTPTMTIFLKKEFNTQKEAERFGKKIKEKKLKNFVDSVSLDLTNKKIRLKLKKIRKSEREEIIEKIKGKTKKLKLKVGENKIEIGSDEDELSIRDLQKIKKKILDLVVTGVNKIINAVIVREEKDWVVKTFGSNLSQIIKMNEIDFKRCYTNNIYEIQDVLGIEAARNILMKEIKDTLQQQGLNVDERHIILIADIMIFTGEIKAIGRYGVAGMKSSVLTRAGFEETVKHLVKASVRNEEDNFKGMFENVMVNQQVPAGTGMFDLIARLGEN
ncbi:MAG: DNA-directed RNA polymerase subunit A'' [Candidatus Aenigmarchaeota archaeon]|nr:DNA-directed RNA polymerase subunit A'' [Candidatus Aenigmarchaeota archaeon]